MKINEVQFNQLLYRMTKIENLLKSEINHDLKAIYNRVQESSYAIDNIEIQFKDMADDLLNSKTLNEKDTKKLKKIIKYIHRIIKNNE